MNTQSISTTLISSQLLPLINGGNRLAGISDAFSAFSLEPPPSVFEDPDPIKKRINTPPLENAATRSWWRFSGFSFPTFDGGRHF